LGAAVADATSVIAERERETVLRLARAIELRDGDTGQHVERLAGLARDMARELGLGPEAAEELFLAAPMHDIGKLAVPDAILKKPGPLTPQEREIIQQHTVYGHAILDGSRSPLLRLAAAIALSHHERWDGAGYPHSLKGEAIPIEARIVAVADVYDALVNKRPYKEAWPAERALQYLRDNAGSQFDPACVAAFLALQAPAAEPAAQCGAA
jgi:HD-GYP domain-containing protein (c-di-GMP phosphodiesterase class II)